MKIFKTILWTTLFWLLVIAGLYWASFFFPQEASIVIPTNVKRIIIENASIEQAIENWEEEPVKIEEEITPTEEEIIEVTNEEEMEDVDDSEEIIPTQAAKSSILPKQKEIEESSDEIEELQNRVYELEAKYDSLVEELQTIFATPLFSQLLREAFNQTEETAE